VGPAEVVCEFVRGVLRRSRQAARLQDLIDDVRLVRVEGGPHNIGWTHPGRGQLGTLRVPRRLTAGRTEALDECGDQRSRGSLPAATVLTFAYDSSSVNAVAGKPGNRNGLFKNGDTQ
jgi:hypothetical protein